MHIYFSLLHPFIFKFILLFLVFNSYKNACLATLKCVSSFVCFSSIQPSDIVTVGYLTGWWVRQFVGWLEVFHEGIRDKMHNGFHYLQKWWIGLRYL